MRWFLNCPLLVFLAWPASCTIEVGGPGGVQKLSFKAPDLTEEDSHSLFVPDDFKCDACVAVAYKVHTFVKTRFNLIFVKYLVWSRMQWRMQWV